MQLSALTSSLGRFFSELHRRKVLRVASLYVVTGWIVLQVALALQTAMALPAGFSTVILSLLIIVLPVALVLSWFFDFTPQGIKRTTGAGEGALAQPQTTDWILIGLLIVVAGATVLQAALPRTSEVPPAVTSEQNKPAPKPGTPLLGDKSIAVLPFANLSPDKENEYFADGLTEELLNLLAKIGDLKVISRTSSFAFKGKNTSLPEIAKQLGVRHILEGSVRSEGDDLKITAQLIDVVSDTHLWSQTYERRIEGIFALQDEIARAIAAALNIEVMLSSSGHDAPTKNLRAYRLYLEGLNAYRNRDYTASQAANLLESAIAADPQFAEAHAMLAGTYVSQIEMAAGSARELIQLARASATTAVRLKPTLGLGYAVLGRLDWRERNWELAIANSRRAVTLAPSDSFIRGWLGSLQLLVGQIETARASFVEASRMDPLRNSAYGGLMVAEAAKGNREATDKLARALIKSTDVPTAGLAHYYIAEWAYDHGDAAKAAEHYLLFLRPAQRERPFATAAIKAFGSAKAKREAVSALVAETETNPGSFSTTIASLALFKANEAILDWLEAHFSSSGDRTISGNLSVGMWDPRHKELRNSPRWHNIVRSMGLFDYWKKHGWPDRCRAKGEDDFECS